LAHALACQESNVDGIAGVRQDIVNSGGVLENRMDIQRHAKSGAVHRPLKAEQQAFPQRETSVFGNKEMDLEHGKGFVAIKNLLGPPPEKSLEHMTHRREQDRRTHTVATRV